VRCAIPNFYQRHDGTSTRHPCTGIASGTQNQLLSPAPPSRKRPFEDGREFSAIPPFLKTPLLPVGTPIAELSLPPARHPVHPVHPCSVFQERNQARLCLQLRGSAWKRIVLLKHRWTGWTGYRNGRLRLLRLSMFRLLASHVKRPHPNSGFGRSLTLRLLSGKSSFFQ
jgi:hypothetical protein